MRILLSHVRKKACEVPKDRKVHTVVVPNSIWRLPLPDTKNYYYYYMELTKEKGL